MYKRQGNTTAAIGKGFAIGSASLAALSLMVSFLYAFQPEGSNLDLNFTNPLILAGALAVSYTHLVPSYASLNFQPHHTANV